MQISARHITRARYPHRRDGTSESTHATTRDHLTIRKSPGRAVVQVPPGRRHAARATYDHDAGHRFGALPTTGRCAIPSVVITHISHRPILCPFAKPCSSNLLRARAACLTSASAGSRLCLPSCIQMTCRATLLAITFVVIRFNARSTSSSVTQISHKHRLDSHATRSATGRDMDLLGGQSRSSAPGGIYQARRYAFGGHYSERPRRPGHPKTGHVSGACSTVTRHAQPHQSRVRDLPAAHGHLAHEPLTL